MQQFYLELVEQLQLEVIKTNVKNERLAPRLGLVIAITSELNIVNFNAVESIREITI